MSRFRLSLLICAYAVGLLGGCAEKKSEQPDAIILHTGRLLGNINPAKAGKAVSLQHYPYLSAYVKKVRAEAAEQKIPVFLIDLGDSLGGSFASYALKGENMVQFFNDLEYDALCLGNLDGDVDPETIAALKAPVLSPFLDQQGEPAMPGTKLAVELAKEGVTLDLAANFYGLTKADDHPLRFPASFGPSEGRPVPVRDYTLMANGFRNKKAIKVLSWMKFEGAGPSETNFLKSLSKMGFDLILAHRIYGNDKKDAWTTNTLLESDPPASINILRSNSGFTVARVDLKRRGDSWHVIQQSITPMTANSVEADPEIVQQMGKFAPVITAADREVAILGAPWKAEDILELYLSALTEVPGADVAAYSLDSVRTGWAKGKLHTSQVFNSLPWRNDVVTVTLPREKLPELKDLGGLALIQRPDLPETVSLVTSRFFARLITQHPGLENVTVASAGPGLEFEFFVKFIQSHDSLEAAKSHEGWINAPD